VGRGRKRHVEDRQQAKRDSKAEGRGEKVPEKSAVHMAHNIYVVAHGRRGCLFYHESPRLTAEIRAAVAAARRRKRRRRRREEKLPRSRRRLPLLPVHRPPPAAARRKREFAAVCAYRHKSKVILAAAFFRRAVASVAHARASYRNRIQSKSENVLSSSACNAAARDRVCRYRRYGVVASRTGSS